MQRNNQKKYTVTLLGTGTSTGIPMLGCKCPVCTSSEPKDQRLRTSALIATNKQKNILIDTTPDLRTQLLRSKIDQIDAVIITHDHADHFHGIDDLRPFTFGPPRRSIPIFTNEQTHQVAKTRFPYIFDPSFFSKDKPVLGGGIPLLDMKPVPLNRTSKILEEDFYFENLPHGHSKTLGLIHRSMAYIIDCQTIPSKFRLKLKEEKLEVLILDCVQYEEHQTHLHFERCLELIEFIKPKRTYLIHMNHMMGHKELEARISALQKQDIFVSFDTQVIEYS